MVQRRSASATADGEICAGFNQKSRSFEISHEGSEDQGCLGVIFLDINHHGNNRSSWIAVARTIAQEEADYSCASAKGR